MTETTLTTDLRECRQLEAEFDAYVEKLSQVLGHADRVAPFSAYCKGLLLPGERKSVEPMAARTAPDRVRSQHQSMHHFVADAPWSDQALLDAVRHYTLPFIEQPEPIQAWIIDDTGLPKKGRHSVGVARQYCGQVGKQDNCQVAVSLSIANRFASLPIAYQLYLPEVWAMDVDKRRKVGGPEDFRFQTKIHIALEQIRCAVADGVPPGVVPADAAYGNNTAFREEVTALGLPYAVGIQPSTTVWTADQPPLPVLAYKGHGRRSKRLQRDAEHQPVSVKELALSLPDRQWRQVTWREGEQALSSRFAAVRARAAHRDRPQEEEWLLMEWPAGEAEPTKYWLSTLPAELPLVQLVEMSKLRWRIERDYQELKQEVGLGHYEGRGWRGFHHHAALSIAAYAFLVAHRSAFSPCAGAVFEAPALPKDYRPRGAAGAR